MRQVYYLFDVVYIVCFVLFKNAFHANQLVAGLAVAIVLLIMAFTDDIGLGGNNAGSFGVGT